MKRSITDHNSWTLPVTITNADFKSLDASVADDTRQSNGNQPINDFLRLADGSDLIGAGVDVGLPYKGSNPDLGAYEADETLPIIVKRIKNGSSLITNSGSIITVGCMKRNGLEALNLQHKMNYNKCTNFEYTTETIMFHTRC